MKLPQPINVTVTTRPTVPEYVTALVLKDQDSQSEDVRVNVNIPARVMYEIAIKFTADTPTGLGDIAITWKKLRESVIHPADLKVMEDDMNLSLSELNDVSAIILQFFDSLGVTKDEDEKDKNEDNN